MRVEFRFAQKTFQGEYLEELESLTCDGKDASFLLTSAFDADLNTLAWIAAQKAKNEDFNYE